MEIYLRNFGFTLLEVLISVTILMILYWSVSSFSMKYKKVELQSVVKEISSALRFAKFYALVNKQKVTVECMIDNNCTKGLRVISESSKLIRDFSWPQNNNNITWSGFQSNRGPIFVANLKSGAANGRYKIMLDDESFMELIVNRFGKVRTVN